MSSKLLLALLAAASLPIAACADPEDPIAEGGPDELAGGFADKQNLLSSVVALLPDYAGVGSRCTATRVSADTFLTAAHCVVDARGALVHNVTEDGPHGFLPNDQVEWVPNPQGAFVFVPPLVVVATALPPVPVGSPGCAAASASSAEFLARCPWDLALVKVRSAAPLTTYSRIATRPVAGGTAIAVVGTGTQAGMDGNDRGLLPQRKLGYASVLRSGPEAPTLFYFRGLANGGQASIAPGDSGGPSFDGRGAIVGVHTFGYYGAQLKDTSTFGADVALGNGIGPWLRSQLPASSFAD